MCFTLVHFGLDGTAFSPFKDGAFFNWVELGDFVLDAVLVQSEEEGAGLDVDGRLALGCGKALSLVAGTCQRAGL